MAHPLHVAATAEPRLPISLFPPREVAERRTMQLRPSLTLVPAEPEPESVPPAFGVLQPFEAAADQIKGRAITLASTLKICTTRPKMEAAQADLLEVSEMALGLNVLLGDYLAGLS